MSICLMFSYAETESEQYEFEYEYEIIDDGVCITYYEGDQPIVIIPEELDGYKVVSIGDCAFSDVQSLWCVIIPDTVKTIEDFAFFESSLKEVYLPRNP